MIEGDCLGKREREIERQRRETVEHGYIYWCEINDYRWLVPLCETGRERKRALLCMHVEARVCVCVFQRLVRRHLIFYRSLAVFCLPYASFDLDL